MAKKTDSTIKHMLFLQYLFVTLSPVEYGATPTVVNVDDNIGFYVSLILLISGFFLHSKNKILRALTFERMTRLFFYVFIFFILLYCNCSIAACDWRIDDVDLHAQVPVPAEVPQLNHPLMPDDYRRVELQQRLSLYFLGRNSWADLTQLLGILEKQMLLEKKIEAALVHDGYDTLDILRNRGEIRGILFNHPTRALALSERTLDGYLSEIARNGTRQSLPYGRVIRAIRNLDIIM